MDKQSGNLHYIIVPTVLKIVKLHTPIVFVYKLWIIFKRNKKHTKLIKSPVLQAVKFPYPIEGGRNYDYLMFIFHCLFILS